MSAIVWKKITRKATPKERAEGQTADVLLAKPWLEIREGNYKTSYRVRYRQLGVRIEEILPGEFKDWKSAEIAGEKLIYEKKYGKKPRDQKGTRSDDLSDEIVGLRAHLSDATYEQTELFFRKHIKPFLRGECAYEPEDQKPCAFRVYVEQGACPYASEFTPSNWLNYKAHIRLHKPTVSLFNHWKFMGMFAKYAFEKGLLNRPMKLAFDEEKEDFRKPGIIMPEEDFRKLIGAANRTWFHRATLQRLTGQRPGVIRKLRKDQVDLITGVVTVEKADSKNRRRYQFVLPDPALRILQARTELESVQKSPYFFPMETDSKRPMDKSLTGWHSAIRRAGILEDYTPHDLRHTYLTFKFKNCRNPALVCYSCDLSLEEAMETYIHFTAEDTRPLAEETTAMVGQLLVAIAPSSAGSDLNRTEAL